MTPAHLDNYLRRYVSLDDALKYLKAGKIVLGEYSHWEDKNEQAALDAYEKVKGLEPKSLRITCFTQAAETHHHWKTYADRGICFVLKFEDIMDQIEAKNLVGQGVKYIKISELKDYQDPAAWPFLKRLPFQDEREFRVISERDDSTIELTPETIDRIYISPWMCECSKEKAKAEILKLSAVHHEKISVYGTTLLTNPGWVKHFKSKLGK